MAARIRLYLHGAGARVQAENCYIEGTVDFVFGDADAYFVNCELHNGRLCRKRHRLFYSCKY